jgi:hypothetical protein
LLSVLSTVHALNLRIGRRAKQVPVESVMELLVAHQRQVEHVAEGEQPRNERPTEEEIRNALARLIQVELVSAHAAEEEGEKKRVGLCLHAGA